MSARALRLDRLLLALLAVVPAGCGGGGGAPPPPPPPSFEVLETSPEQDADGIEPEAVVVGISLSDAASAATALPTAAVVSVGGQPAPMVVTWSVDRTSLAIVVGGLIPPVRGGCYNKHRRHWTGGCWSKDR